MVHLSDNVKSFVDGTAMAAAVGVFFQVVPDLISLMTLVWIIIRILETDTVKSLRNDLRDWSSKKLKNSGNIVPTKLKEGNIMKAAKKAPATSPAMKEGGEVKKMAKGGSTGSASKRADGIAQRGKTKGKFV